MKRNRIGAGGTEDLKGLLEITNLSTLDLSDNRIADEEVVEEILTKIPNLGVLYL